MNHDRRFFCICYILLSKCTIGEHSSQYDGPVDYVKNTVRYVMITIHYVVNTVHYVLNNIHYVMKNIHYVKNGEASATDRHRQLSTTV